MYVVLARFYEVGVGMFKNGRFSMIMFMDVFLNFHFYFHIFL